jgi:hypothetical protein
LETLIRANFSLIWTEKGQMTAGTPLFGIVVQLNLATAGKLVKALTVIADFESPCDSTTEGEEEGRVFERESSLMAPNPEKKEEFKQILNAFIARRWGGDSPCEIDLTKNLD